MANDAQPDEKTCVVCGREMTPRRRWRDLHEVKYCSAACRKRKLGPTDEALEHAIEALLKERARGATICPSEAARAVATAGEGAVEWRALMEPARMAARRLVARGKLEITQGGKAVDPSRAKGPIRLRAK